MSTVVQSLARLLGHLLGLGPFEAAGGAPEAEPDWVAGLDAWHRRRLLEVALAVARCDGRLEARELALVRKSFPAMAPTRETLAKALAAVEHVQTAEDAVAFVRASAPDLAPAARRFALDVAVAVLSLGEGAHRRLAPAFAEALGLSAADAERALEANIVFVRRDPRGRAPYR